MVGLNKKFEARLKPCDVTSWRFGRWRPVKRIRKTVDKADNEPIDKETEIRACRGGGVPIGYNLIEYNDHPRIWFESWFSFEWNIEIREVSS